MLKGRLCAKAREINPLAPLVYQETLEMVMHIDRFLSVSVGNASSVEHKPKKRKGGGREAADSLSGFRSFSPSWSVSWTDGTHSIFFLTTLPPVSQQGLREVSQSFINC